MEFLRPTFAEIDLYNLVHNLQHIKSKLSKKTKLLAVVKANAYGHGAVRVSKALMERGVDLFGVSSIEEGAALRDAGIEAPVLILGSQYPMENFTEVIRRSLTPTVASYEAAAGLSSCAKGLNVRVGFHYKIDTGMGRIGVAEKNAFEVFKKISKLDNINIEGIYTHLAKADTDRCFTKNQVNSLKGVALRIRSLINKDITVHAANSASVLNMKESHLDMARVGLGLYGLKPFKGAGGFEELKPVLSLRSRIVFLKQVPKNTPVSYGSTFRTKKLSRIATVPVGYADGYNRLLSNKGSVILKGRKCPVIGSVTMDMIMLDVTSVEDVRVGNDVLLIGSDGKVSVSAEDMAGLSKTISYEIACQISGRVPRVYKG